MLLLLQSLVCIFKYTRNLEIFKFKQIIYLKSYLIKDDNLIRLFAVLEAARKDDPIDHFYWLVNIKTSADCRSGPI